jgi:hypothetical protein
MFLALFEATSRTYQPPEVMPAPESTPAPTRDPEQESRVTAQIRKVVAQGIPAAAESPTERASKIIDRIKAEVGPITPAAASPPKLKQPAPNRGLSDRVMDLMGDGKPRLNVEIRQALGMPESESQAISNALGTLRGKNLICKGADLKWIKAVKP